MPGTPSEAHDPEERVAALERGLAAVVERVEEVERLVEEHLHGAAPDPGIGLP